MENSLNEPCTKLRKGSKTPFTKKFFFFKIPDLVHRPTAAEMSARWRSRLPIKNLTLHYNGSLF